MKIDLTGKTALVTGSTIGIGFAIAQGLAETGATVVLNGRKEKAVQEAIGRLQKLVPGAKLVIRTGLDDGSRRARFTRRVDALSRLVGWMNAAPQRYPAPEALRARFDAAGLHSEFAPLRGRTPFNNWRIVATKP